VGVVEAGRRDAGLALVLAGGGARGAYEAGVLRYLLDTLPRRAGEPVSPEMLCGTSAGALNAAFLASGADRAHALSKHWQTVRLADVYQFGMPELVHAPFRILGRSSRDRAAILDTRSSRAWIESRIDWTGVRATLDAGRLGALVVGTTLVRSGRSVWYVDGPRRGSVVDSRHPAISYRHSRIGPEHVRASSAIPLLFPPVEVDGELMLDGGLRQNTPLGPAVRLGASHVIVVHTQPAFDERVTSDDDARLGLASLLGKALNALMLDPIDRDLSNLQLVNSILEWGEEAYGEGHVERLNLVAGRALAMPLRRVESLLLRPSIDVGCIAADIWNRGRVGASRTTRWFLDTLSRSEDAERKELLAYILFDRSFTAELELLGHWDAAAREDEIARFLGLGFDRRASAG
jgi:NTE family protein